MECKECKECNVHACEKNFELCDYLGSDVIFGQATKFLTGDDAIICNVNTRHTNCSTRYKSATPVGSSLLARLLSVWSSHIVSGI